MRFFSILAAHPDANVRALADSVPDPELDKNTFRFFILVRGAKTPSKMYVINCAMTIYAVNLTMLNKTDDSVLDLVNMDPKEKAKLQYQPSSFSTFYKHIFSIMKTEGIAFKQSNFNSYQGSFKAAIKEKFEETLKHRPTYGKRKPSPVDMRAQEKMRNAFKSGLIDPFNIDMSDKGKKSGYNDLLPALCHKIGCSVGPRGQKEPHAMTYSSFEYGIEEEVNEHKGLRYIRLQGFNEADKTAKLTLSNPWQYKTGGFLKMWDNRKDPLNVVNLFFFYVEKHLKPAMDMYGLVDAPLFNRRAPNKELKVCI